MWTSERNKIKHEKTNPLLCMYLHNQPYCKINNTSTSRSTSSTTSILLLTTTSQSSKVLVPPHSRFYINKNFSCTCKTHNEIYRRVAHPFTVFDWTTMNYYCISIFRWSLLFNGWTFCATQLLFFCLSSLLLCNLQKDGLTIFAESQAHPQTVLAGGSRTQQHRPRDGAIVLSLLYESEYENE